MEKVTRKTIIGDILDFDRETGKFFLESQKNAGIFDLVVL